jgi:uncharacterized membrane protein YraQ (UPF0718 family)
MLGGPIINVVVMLSTYVAFSGVEKTPAALQQPAAQASAATDSAGQALAPATTPPPPQFTGWEMMGLRVGLGFLIAFGTSLIVEWQYRKHGNRLLAPLAIADTKLSESRGEEEDEDAAKASRSWFERIGNIAETSLHDFVDITVYLILGALLAALSRLLLPPEKMQSLALSFPTMAIAIMMGLAILMCICSEADAFVAASFRLLPPAPKLAFLLLGPMLDFKLYMMYTRIFRPRLIWTIIAAVVVQVFVYSLLVHVIWEAFY